MSMHGQGEEPTGPGSWPLAGLLTLTAAVFVAVTTEFLPFGLLPAMSEGLRTTESRVGLLVTAYAFVVALSAIPLTRATIRWPRKRLLIVVLVGYAASNAVLAFSHVYLLAAAVRIFAGVCHAVFFSIVPAYAAGVVVKVRLGRAVAVVWVGTSLALLIGLPLGTALGTEIGWRRAFLALSILVIVVAIVASWLLPALPASDESRVMPLSDVLRLPGLAVIGITTGLVMLGNFTLYTYISPFLMRAGLDAAMTGPALLVFGTAGVVGLWYAAVTVDRRPRIALLVTLSLLTAVLATLSFAGTITVASMICLGLWGLAYGALPTFFNAAALRAAPDAHDTATAIINTSFNIGIGGGALLGAAALSLGGLQALAPIAAVLTAAGLILVGLSGGAAFPALRHDSVDG
jgi:predicted MFS family arabinose efflux permease